MKKKVSIANENGLTRLKAIEMRQKGMTLKAVAERFGVHYSTVSAWVEMYEAGGVERLSTYRKPRPKHELSVQDLREDIAMEKDAAHKRVLESLLALAEGNSLRETAAKFGVTEQGLAKRRRKYLEENHS